jgi:hypothetical protein
LPLFAKARSDYAVDRVLDNFRDNPSLAQIYSAYLVKFNEEKEIRDVLEDIFIEDELLFDWQRMWILAVLTPHTDSAPKILRRCSAMLGDSRYHEALRALAAIYIAKFGDHRRRIALFSEFASIGHPYIQAAMLYGSRYFRGVEKRNAIAAWGSHSEVNTLIAESGL